MILTLLGDIAFFQYGLYYVRLLNMVYLKIGGVIDLCILIDLEMHNFFFKKYCLFLVFPSKFPKM